MTTLSEWMAANKLTQMEVAHRLHTSQGHVNDLLRKGKWPRRETVWRIMKMTGGAVTANDFLGTGMSRKIADKTLTKKTGV